MTKRTRTTGRKKRSYQAIWLSRIDQNRVSQQVEGGHVDVGIDVAKETLYARLERRDDPHAWDLTVKWKQPQDTVAFVQFLRNLPATKIEVAMEPSGTYGDVLRYQLTTAGMGVYLVSAKRSHDMAEAYDGVPSYHDAKSAAILTKMHRDGVSVEWRAQTELDRDLRAAVDTMVRYRDEKVRAGNQLEAYLSWCWPELETIVDRYNTSTLSLLETFGSPETVAARRKEAAKVLRRSSRGRLSAVKIARILESARTTTAIPMTEGERRELQRLAGDLLRVHAGHLKATTRVERLTEKDVETQRVGHVIGRGTAGVLRSYLGTFAGYESGTSAEKAAGLLLKERSSGRYKGQRKITKRGPGIVRRELYLAALRLIQHDRIACAWYHERLRRNGGNKGKGIVALMRKLIRAMWYVARGAEFDTRRLFDVRRLEIQPVAK